MGRISILVFFSLYLLFISIGRSDNYDRLDGLGASKTHVSVIEWGENLEFHIKPKGAIQKLGLFVDDRDAARPVMVVTYYFNGGNKLIRRVILGIKFSDSNFSAYKDDSDPKLDRIIVSSTRQAFPMATIVRGRPASLYPEE